MSFLPGDLPFDLGGENDPSTYAHARMLAALLPPGRLWRLIPGASTLHELLVGSAIELSGVTARANDLINEADPSTATELLPEYERQFDLTAAPSIAERRARIVARTIQRQRYRPVDFQTALAPLLGQDAVDVVVIERTLAFCAEVGDSREIFRFFVYRDPGAPGAYFLASAQEQIDRMKPSHTVGHAIESIAFLCGDPFSLCGRDIIDDSGA